MSKELNTNFLDELFRLFLLRKSMVERVQNHLKYQMLPNESYKIVYRDILNHVNLTGNLPTFGILYEQNNGNKEVANLLNKVRDAEIVEPEGILRQLEKFIKDVRFQNLWDDVIKVHNEGKELEAIRLMAEGSTEIAEFSIFKDSGTFLKVFQDFQKVHLNKQIAKEENVRLKKIPFGILPCDIITEGGADRKETILWLLRSGVGKSTILKYMGMYACRLGFDVLHIQLEGAEEEAFDKYTQIWSALSYSKVRNSSMSDEDYQKLLSIAAEMVTMKQDIHIKAYDQFDETTMVDVRDAVIEYIKLYGKQPDLLLLDSIDLSHPGDGIKYGADTQSVKMKLQNSARKFKNICNEFDMVGATASQTGDVSMDIWNDPDKVITRSHSMGDRNLANSFSFVFTGNQTMDEEKRQVMRIFFDKVRYYNPKARVYPIATHYELGRFQNTARTKKLFKDIYCPEDSDE